MNYFSVFNLIDVMSCSCICVPVIWWRSHTYSRWKQLQRRRGFWTWTSWRRNPEISLAGIRLHRCVTIFIQMSNDSLSRSLIETQSVCLWQEKLDSRRMEDSLTHQAILQLSESNPLDQITDSCNTVITEMKCNDAKNDQMWSNCVDFSG